MSEMKSFIAGILSLRLRSNKTKWDKKKLTL